MQEVALWVRVDNLPDVKVQDGAVWKKVFYHNSRNGTVLWTGGDAEALSSNTADKYSILGQLEDYRNSSGQLEFLLEYPEMTGYNRWLQTSNPATSSPHIVTGYTPVGTPTWTTQSWAGLARTMNSANSFIDGNTALGTGTTNWYYSLGCRISWPTTAPYGIPGPNGTVQEVELWVRIDNLPNYKVAYGAVWKKVFYHNAQNNTVWWTGGDAEALSSNIADKYSILGQLDNFKRSNGEFEFLMESPSVAGFNRWKQKSNPATSAVGTITGYVPTNVSWTTNGWGGLGRSADTANAFIDGTPTTATSNYWYPIGQKQNWIDSANGRSGIPVANMGVQELYLWVRMDNLIVP